MPVVLLTGQDDAALACLRPAAETLAFFGIEVDPVVLSATSLDTVRMARRCAVIVASPDGALPAAIASGTKAPVLRVPTETADRRGLALLNNGEDQLPAGSGDAVFATMAIGAAGAKNAALFVVATLAVSDERLRVAYADYRARQSDAVLHHPPLEP